ncbi:hypothetical protein FOXB_01741 [Fusarium oxysporum f. sp. conglutinans Fo5176]|uniref:Reverse transcriptase domain-containing protein n=1 Tax=Fusarium oxysporum (strain Fo5176) TaxID=660025 RepID=F9F5R6_FUSOF|nr:hypothetical protein FOXB_01741 [Fusarium oxysporum f. sp. conglutinans Fo5176]
MPHDTILSLLTQPNLPLVNRANDGSNTTHSLWPDINSCTLWEDFDATKLTSWISTSAVLEEHTTSREGTGDSNLIGHYAARLEGVRPSTVTSATKISCQAIVNSRTSGGVHGTHILTQALKRRGASPYGRFFTIALMLLQEEIYAAWRGRWILSLLFARIALRLLRSTDRHPRELPQAGLPQGSPLSPILFFFFNADLVQQRIDCYGGATAFVYDFTAWVTGPTAESNRDGMRKTISKALDWERRSGATFETEKTAIIDFTRKAYKSDEEPFAIRRQLVPPKSQIKVLGVIMDASLKYKEHIARAAAKGLNAAMERQRLKGLTPRTARQLFAATVALVVDYASNDWGKFNRGDILTVATSVAEAEAHIASVNERFWKRAIKMWTDLHTLPTTNPLRSSTSRIRKFRRYNRSPFLRGSSGTQ